MSILELRVDWHINNLCLIIPKATKRAEYVNFVYVYCFHFKYLSMPMNIWQVALKMCAEPHVTCPYLTKLQMRSRQERNPFQLKFNSSIRRMSES